MTDAAEVDLPRRPAGEEPREFRVQVGDLSITAFEWAGEGRPVLLAHATGFHARTWDAVARLLPGRRVVAVDFRGHGRSDNPEPPILWSHFAQDLVAVAEHAGLEGVVGVGHSMGGRCVTFAAAAAPSRFASLLLVDPVMFNREAQEGAPSAPPQSGAFHFVAKRRNEWASPEEMVERFRDRFPYNAWAPGVLEDYAKWGLLPNPDGEGLVLACPPAIEASIYGSSASEPPGVQADAIRAVQVPVRVIRARQRQPGEEAPPFATSPTRPDLASLFARGEDLLMPQMSHFIPMQDPAFVARQILDLASRA